MALRRMVEEETTPEDRRLRFFSVFRTLSPELCARRTHIGYEREMALIAIAPAAGAEESLGGGVWLAADPDRERAEYAVLVRSDLKGHGLGTALMHAIIDYAKAQGIGELFGAVLRENRTMLNLAKRLGFRVERDPDDPEIVEVRLPLGERAEE